MAFITESIPTALSTTLRAAPTLVAPEPEHCPGPKSDAAGQSDACAGCPNQQICATAPKGPDPDIPLIVEALAGVKHKVLVLSGKGGVGKSSFSVLLAQTFSSAEAARLDSEFDEESDDGHGPLVVGLLDADFCGPSIPRMLMGAEGTAKIHKTSGGWLPHSVSDTLLVMSIQFMLPDEDSAVIWSGTKKNGLIKQFLQTVQWGNLDLLLVDTPPGTSDEHLSISLYLKESGIDGAILVTTPAEVSLLDVRKELDFCRKAKIHVIGIVENMAGFVCPNCTKESQIFRPTTGGARKLCLDENIPFLGSVPLDPRIGMACDLGDSFLDTFPESAAAKSIMSIVEVVAKSIGIRR